MNFTAIDYSLTWFKQHYDGTVPKRRGGKFVVLQEKMHIYMLFCPIQQAEYHANIVALFTQERKLSGHYNDKRDVYHLTAEQWQIQGGGHWLLDEEAHLLRLYGRSMAYGTVSELARLIPALKTSQVFAVEDIVCSAS
ncbi:hypothetical protein [Thioflexithrix psekupsensis]|uniref:Uncharacterized protein n=1 Tax=Thioflexithrix psekupsensis TaxID=1570016 RepID=A0A251X378_9GAMM|nr:hypothetical protein [Thioflexithrix psekupsensis]OUD11735.1 hypothetical protein TPSD3_16940 [Thioflexithrix psekupsensis]